MRRLVALLLCCLTSTGCARLVDVRALPIEVTPVPAPQETLVYAADGTLIATLRLAHRSVVTRADVPQVLVDAVVAAEDRGFFEHHGVDGRAVLRAAVANRRAGRVVQGGSTITQQLVKNRYFPAAEDTLERKAAEARLALDLERTTTKDEILVEYLNTIYLGAGAYGVQAASRTYFGHDVDELTLPEAALLAGLIRRPESASPYTAPERAYAERARVLDGMVATGTLARPTADAVATEPLGVGEPPRPPVTRFPRFVAHVTRTLLADPSFGADEPARVRALFGGGLRVHTTIDPALQAVADAAATLLPSPADPEVAIAVVRPSNGDIVATVGGRDPAARPFDLATQARRQPGSAFKTFALVAALRSGWRLDDRLESGPAALPLGGGEVWHVRSRDDGRLSLRDALAASSNGVFARLAVELGPARVAEQARLMGVTSAVGAHPAAVLGGLSEGVSPLQMAAAYAALANGGVAVAPTPVDRVTTADGAVLWRAPRTPVVAAEAGTAWLATSALRGVVESGTGTAAAIDRPAAGKTGTSQNNRDAWFVGYTPDLAAAVWVGYPDVERPLVDVRGVDRVEGGTWPARIWQRLMLAALAGTPPRDFAFPQHEATTVDVDPLSGDLAGPWCPLRVPVTGLPAELPTATCTLHGPPPPPPPAAPRAPSRPPDSAPAPAPPAGGIATAAPSVGPTAPPPPAAPSADPAAATPPPADTPAPPPPPSESPTPQAPPPLRSAG